MGDCELDFVASRSTLRLQIIAQHPDFGGFLCFDDFSIHGPTNVGSVSLRSGAVSPSAVVNPVVYQSNVGVHVNSSSSPMIIFPALEVCWLSEFGKTYQLQWTSQVDGTNWTNLGGSTQASEATTCVFDSTRHSGARFYRVISHDR